MSRMSDLSLQMDEARARFCVIGPQGQTSFYRTRAWALARVAFWRALGRTAHILER